MHRSRISWTDYSGGKANFVQRGSKDCKISPGCANCYVDRSIARVPDWPEYTTVDMIKLDALSRIRPRPNDTGYRRGSGFNPMVFVCDTGDLFHESVSQWVIFHALDIFYMRKDITWQLLTKRPARMYELVTMWLMLNQRDTVPNWMWMGVTVENQQCAKERRSLMAALPAEIRWVSYEPALGPVDWTSWEFINWLVVGGESGKDARPMFPAWAYAARDSNIDAFFFKQWGEWRVADDGIFERPGRKAAGHLLDGREWHEFPV